MRLPQQFPLNGELGYPRGITSERGPWLAEIKRIISRNRRTAILVVVGLTLLFGTLGMLSWWLQRITSPGRLAQHLSSNMPTGNAHLGAEYYNIASALVRGRGFADPFIVESGPTAWMPPLLVWIQAFFIWCFSGDRFWVMQGVVAIKTLVLAVGVAAVVNQGRRVTDTWWAFAVVLLFFVAEFSSCFAFTHDSWLILAGVTGTTFGLAAMESKLRNRRLTNSIAVCWGLGGGIIALSSPVAGFTWAVGSVIFLLRRAPAKLLIAAVVSMLVVTPWAIRNRQAFGRWIPIKSNVYFELDQSLALDDDGLLDWRTMSTHPYHPGVEQDTYVSLGEIAYVDTKKARFQEQYRTNPSEFHSRVKRRLLAVTLFPLGFSEYQMPSPSLPLMWVLYPMPFIAILVLVIWGRPLQPIQFWSIVVYMTYLSPYILCSYYPRYGFPLLIVKMLLCYWLINSIRTALQSVAGQFRGI